MTSPRRFMQKSMSRSEEHTSELQSLRHLVCRLLLEKIPLSLLCSLLAHGRLEIGARHGGEEFAQNAVLPQPGTKRVCRNPARARVFFFKNSGPNRNLIPFPPGAFSD